MKNPKPPESKHKQLHVTKIEKPGSMKGNRQKRLGVLGLLRSCPRGDHAEVTPFPTPVCKTSKFCHITPVLHSLHWLRIKYRIDFNINTLVYKTLHTNQPVYLRESLSLSEKQRTRASGTRELIRPRSPINKAGSRAFYVVASYLWNSLPAEVRTAETYSIFRKKLKTHFFASCSPS